MRSADGTTQQTPEGDGDVRRPAEPDDGERARIGFIGKKLGRFLINAELGRGGMATVYRAHDPQLGRDVAVKVMHGFFAGRAEIEARFRREATAVAAIRHPSILALYDFAPPAGEEPGYIVSELIEGPGLRRLVDDHGGRLLPEVSVLIAIRVAEALGAAHAAGIVHRDVKPDNVLIDRSGGGARVVLTDFGVAHVSGMDTMTATGAVLGSPAYMSPEQARGSDVGPPSDIFSLGVLLYQLCTGHLPFVGKDPLIVIAALLRGEYMRPGTIEARVGPGLEQVIARCLQRDAAARFPDGAAVTAALRDHLTAADLSDEGAALARYLGDPDAFEREVSPKIAAAALAAAERARRGGQHPRALAEVGRALAYAPDDPSARDLLSRIGSRPRRRWIGVGIGAGAVAAVALTLTLSLTPFSSPRVGTPANSTAVSASRPEAKTTVVAASAPQTAAQGSKPVSGETAPAATPSDVRPTAPALPPSRPPAALAATAAARVTPRQRRSAPGIGVRESPKTLAAPPVPLAPEPAAVEGAGSPEPQPPEATPSPTLAAKTEGQPDLDRAAADRPATARIVLRAWHRFCEPSLDEHTPSPSLRASYDNLAPGPHEIFCTLPEGGGKVHVATYDLRPGTHPSVIIIRDPEGRPILGRPE